MTQVEISYFAWVRERMGQGSEMVDLPPTVVTISDLVAWLAARDGAGAAAFGEPGKIRAAVDGAMVGGQFVIDNAREIALFPPVTGG